MTKLRTVEVLGTTTGRLGTVPGQWGPLRVDPAGNPVPHLYVEYDDSEEYVQLDKWRVYRRWHVQVDDPDHPPFEFDVEVDDDGSLRVRRLTVEPRGDEGLTARAARVPFVAYAEQSMPAAVASTPQPHVGDRGGLRPDPPEGARTFAEDVYARWRDYSYKARRGAEVPDEHLQAVAEVYRAALDQGDHPTKTVATKLHLNPSTAARHVMLARDRKFLGQAPKPRTKGEI